MTSFPALIEKIEQEISIEDSDRESYTKEYDQIREAILSKLSQNAVFKALYNGTSLFGSYLENIKISAPDEFDVHIILKLPYEDKMVVRGDRSRPGFVNVDLREVVKSCQYNGTYNFIIPVLNQITDNNYYISCPKFQKWLEEIFFEALPNGRGTVNTSFGRQYTLIYKRGPTAHTFEAICGNRKISIDLVPAFKVMRYEGLGLDRTFPSEGNKVWFAVPKPIKMGDPNTREYIFSVCAPHFEKSVLIDKQHLKQSLRLLKSIRDKMTQRYKFAYKLSSYMLKTIYLWENENQSNAFWNQSSSTLLLHMVDVLIIHLQKEKIPFYWAVDQNLLFNLKRNELESLKQGFIHVKDVLRRNSTAYNVDIWTVRSLFDV